MGRTFRLYVSLLRIKVCEGKCKLCALKSNKHAVRATGVRPGLCVLYVQQPLGTGTVSQLCSFCQLGVEPSLYPSAKRDNSIQHNAILLQGQVPPKYYCLRRHRQYVGFNI